MATEIFFNDIFCPTDGFLYYDEACLIIQNVINETLSLYRTLDICYKCTPDFWTNVPAMGTISLLVPTYAVTSIQYVHLETGQISCVVSYYFEQHGIYKYVTDFSCDTVQVIKIPDHPYTSFLIFAVVSLTLWVLYMLLSYLNVRERLVTFVRRRLQSKSHENLEVQEMHTTEPFMALSGVEVMKKVVYDEDMDKEHVVEYVSRGMNTASSWEDIDTDDWYSDLPPKPLEFVEFESLLAMRGLTVCLWVYLDVEGHTVPLFQRSPWEGFNLDDIPIGWFYWVLAASFYLHLFYSRSQGMTRKRVLLHGVLLRSICYIAAGYVYNNINNTSRLQQDSLPPFPPLDHIRVFGILQRVGLSHLVISSFEICFMKKQIKPISNSLSRGLMFQRGPFFQDLQDTWPQWLVALFLVLIHTCVTYLMPVPDCPTGYLGPGGRSNFSSAHYCTGGAAGYIDWMLFTEDHLLPIRALEGSAPVYNIKVSFDPQGLLGTLTTCFLMALAMQASRIFIYFHHPLGRIIRLAAWSLCQLLLGAILCSFQKHGGLVPVNHYLMSLSYVLLVSGLAFLVLLTFYCLINIWQIWSGFPLIYTGVNILVVFFASYLFQHTLPFRWEITDEHMHTNQEFLVQAFWSICLWSYICYQLLSMRLVCPV